MTNLEKIKEVAKKVRKAFEEIESRDNVSFSTGNLGGYCGRASVQLYLVCKYIGIKIGLHEGYHHIFNTYNGTIIDITATQFGIKDKVYIKKIPKDEKRLDDFHTTICIHSIEQAETIYGTHIDTIKDKKVVFKYLEENIGVQKTF